VLIAFDTLSESPVSGTSEKHQRTDFKLIIRLFYKCPPHYPPRGEQVVKLLFLAPLKKNHPPHATISHPPRLSLQTKVKQMKGTYLGEFEELVLLSVGILFDDAYGLAIVDELEKQTGRNIMISSAHKALARLEEKGYLKSRMGGATETRGGRYKRLYQLTQAGKKVLAESRELRNSMWKQVPKIVWEVSTS
jgi:PadR family transcriptional regulator, regulatory protein PadR